MRAWLSRAVMGMLVLGAVPMIAAATTPDRYAGYQGYSYVPSRVLVMLDATLSPNIVPFRDASGTWRFGDTQLDAVCAKLQVARIVPILHGQVQILKPGMTSFMRTYIIDYRADVMVQDAVDAFAALQGRVTISEPDGLMAYDVIVPNDTRYGSQYAPSRIGADAFWERFGTGDSMTLVIPLDSGLDWDHPDLMPRLWLNPGEDANHNGVLGDSTDVNGRDDDHNGLADDLFGYDFVDLPHGTYIDDDPYTLDWNPRDCLCDGHGTHVAGCAVAQTNNEMGIAGVCWNCRLVALRCGY